VHLFDGRACNSVIVSVMRSLSGCLLGACEILVSSQVPAKFLLVAVVFKLFILLKLEL
jgi:hypothetical protein